MKAGQWNNPLHFFAELLKQPNWVIAWVSALMMINLLSLAFWEQTLAKLIFAVFMVSAMIMTGLYAKFGFQKILGIGHILWVPLLFYVASNLPGTGGIFHSYLMGWSVCVAISLVFDFIDVWKYFTAPKKTTG